MSGGSWSFEFSVPVEKSNLGGPISFRWPAIPTPPMCACCLAQEGLLTQSAHIVIPGYRSQETLIPYSLCPACDKVRRAHDRAVSIATLVLTVLSLGFIGALFWKTSFASKQPFLTIGGSVAAGIAGGVIAYLMTRAAASGSPHTSCSGAVTAFAAESGSRGAFGKKISPGTLAVQLTFTAPEYGQAVQRLLPKDLLAP